MKNERLREKISELESINKRESDLESTVKALRNQVKIYEDKIDLIYSDKVKAYDTVQVKIYDDKIGLISSDKVKAYNTMIEVIKGHKVMELDKQIELLQIMVGIK